MRWIILLFIFAGCYKEQKRSSNIYLQKASYYIGSESYKLAEKEIKNAIKINPKDYNAWLLLGNLYDKTGENKKAIEAYIVGIRLKGRKDEKMDYSLRDPFKPMPRKKSLLQ